MNQKSESNQLQILNKNQIPVNSIRIDKINLSDKIENIDIYKQRNLKNEENQRILREKAKKNKVLKNKHQYLSQNAYNNTNIEGILFERDMDLQRSFRFEKKELKSKNLNN